jgi:hypothetical protein
MKPSRTNNNKQSVAAPEAGGTGELVRHPEQHHRSRDSIDYNMDLEQLLKDNAEECESLGILHRAAYEKYNRLSNYINIPVIILSSAIGFATGIDIGYANMNIILGVGSIFVGIIKSIDTYFQLGKRSESHRLCSLQYQQIHKKIQIELALTRNQRQTAKDMLSVIKTDIKNLQDISPLIDQDTIDNYNKRYGQYTSVKKPNFVNGLTEVVINSTSHDEPDKLHSRPRSPAGSVSGSGSVDGSMDGGSEEVDVYSDGGGGGGGGISSSNSINRLMSPINIKPIIHHQVNAGSTPLRNMQPFNIHHVSAALVNHSNQPSPFHSQASSHHSARSHISARQSNMFNVVSSRQPSPQLLTPRDNNAALNMNNMNNPNLVLTDVVQTVPVLEFPNLVLSDPNIANQNQSQQELEDGAM